MAHALWFITTATSKLPLIARIIEFLNIENETRRSVLYRSQPAI